MPSTLAMYITTTVLLATCLAQAAAQEDKRYTVWASAMFSRTGERTPQVLGTLPWELTSVGAQQQFSSGSSFRKRYFGSADNDTTTNGIDLAPLVGLNPEVPDVQRLYVQALDEQWGVASAQAFLQGLYPPVSFKSNESEIQELVDPINRLANHSYLDPPLGGYRYVQIHSSGEYDPNFIYVGGSLECPAFIETVQSYYNTADFTALQAATTHFYKDVGSQLLEGVLPPDQWTYANSYAIYDYLSYQNDHNATAEYILSSSPYKDEVSPTTYLDQLRQLSNQQQWAWYTNLYEPNDVLYKGFPAGIQGSISTIAGNTLAAKMLQQLQAAIETQGQYFQLSILFGDYEPLLSLFALMDLSSQDGEKFNGMPNFGSIAVFELFSQASKADVSFPAEEDLWVRFYFRNGTDANESLESYSMFNNGPDTLDMRWTDFFAAMYRISLGDIGEWCRQCAAEYIQTDRVFCSYWNASDSISGDPPVAVEARHHGISPAVGGVIGAIVTLVVAGLIFALLMLLGGFRLHRIKSHKSDLGGFKGSQKLASDRDLTMPKGGAIVGATVETPGSPIAGGHERVGSWELKEPGMPNIAASHQEVRRPSYEQDEGGDIGINPFRDPVKPDERV